MVVEVANSYEIKSKTGIILTLIENSTCKLPGLRIYADPVCLF